MRYARLGNSELNVSCICMGCMGFGDAKNGQHTWTIDEEHTREIIRKGLESGINFYDTAIGYQSGTSEQYLGRTLRDYVNRDEVIVATKFLPRTPEEIDAILAERRARWQPKPRKYAKGVLRLFSALAASPMKGAYLDYDALNK